MGETLTLAERIAHANRAISAREWRVAAAAISAAREQLADASVLDAVYGQVLANLSALQLREQDPHAALTSAEQAVMWARKPAHQRLAAINLAASFLALQRYPESIACYEKLRQQPSADYPYDASLQRGHEQALLAYSRALELANDTDRARTIGARLAFTAPEIAQETEQESTAAKTTTPAKLRALALPWVLASEQQLGSARTQFAAALARLQDSAPVRSLEELVHSNFVLAYQANDDLALNSAYGDWLCQRSAPFQPRLAPAIHKRIGLVSSFWRECTVGNYFASWLRALKHSGFEVELFQQGPQQDASTQEFLAQVDHGEVLLGDLQSQAQIIAARGLQVLIYPELGMDGRTLVLASLRLAETQLCAWGHPVTSGLPSIDGYLSCADMEPVNATEHYREPLLLLPGLGTAYRQPAIPEPRGWADLQQEFELPNASGPRIFFPQSTFKITPVHDALMVALSQRLPGAQWLMFESAQPAQTDALRSRLTRAFSHAGLPVTQLHWLPMMPRERFLQIARHCDFALDSLGFSGGNTSLDCLIMQLPIISHEGEFMRGRQTAAMLRALNCQELIVNTAELNFAPALELAERLCFEPGFKTSLQSRIASALPEYLRAEASLARLVETVLLIQQGQRCSLLYQSTKRYIPAISELRWDI